MKYLADTHILLWILAEDLGTSQLSNKAKDILSDDDTELYFSFINVWEVALKRIKHPERYHIRQRSLNICAKNLGLDSWKQYQAMRLTVKV